MTLAPGKKRKLKKICLNSSVPFNALCVPRPKLEFWRGPRKNEIQGGTTAVVAAHGRLSIQCRRRFYRWSTPFCYSGGCLMCMPVVRLGDTSCFTLYLLCIPTCAVDLELYVLVCGIPSVNIDTSECTFFSLRDTLFCIRSIPFLVCGMRSVNIYTYLC